MKTGITLVRLESIPSTNVYAASLIEKNLAVDGMVIVASHQTAGKGQDHNQWESKPGENLTLTIIIKPGGLQPSQQFILNEYTSLAVRDFILSMIPGTEVSIKWPNDVYAGDKKIAGILISNIIAGSKINWSVIGIGINVNQSKFESGAPNPISLKQLSGLTFDLDHCLQCFLDRFDNRFRQMQEYKFELVHYEYLNSLFRKGVSTEFVFRNQQITATITGIAEFGHLIIQTTEGDTLLCDQREIKMIV